ncbi:MAG: hypothetical protein VB084_09475 [Syntrophomonadaceae bacterium]|nr:hypothetical protein [Syntrophomonadaceae bacterium]
MENTLAVKDRDTVLHISYEDMIKYHGRFHIGGVAMAFKALELGLGRLVPNEIPSRHKISFTSGLGESATGVLDAVEMSTRARTRGQLAVDPNLGQDLGAPETPNGGRFCFEIAYDGVKLGLVLKEGLVPQEFMDLSRRAIARTLDREGARRLQEVKEEMAAALISKPAEELFKVISE